MYQSAIGIIETVGLVGSIEAADAMSKCAEVHLVDREDVGGGLHAVIVRGDVGSVKAALEAGIRAAEAVGGLHGALLIPRPAPQVQALVLGNVHSSQQERQEIESMNVHQLRSLARQIKDLSLTGREISRANRDQLLELLRAEFEESDETEG
ncbi:MAG TPA: BMC domain-containing protein [Planctomycetes bacterium]|nr:BMC domain-containing protein [Planctomycetota bacterium]HIN80773.1 BMC domain-containing protein [Planctomycetota bacterium]